MDNGSSSWKLATGAAAAVAIALGAFAYTQHNSVTELTAKLAAATADSQQAHASASSLSAQLDAAKKDAETAHAAATGLQSQVQASEAQASAEQQQLQSTEAKLAAEKRPDLPITVEFKKPLLRGGAIVAILHNPSHETIEVTVYLESKATGQNRRQTLVVPPITVSAGREFKPAQWAFAPGQRIALVNPAYRPYVQTVGG